MSNKQIAIIAGIMILIGAGLAYMIVADTPTSVENSITPPPAGLSQEQSDEEFAKDLEQAFLDSEKTLEGTREPVMQEINYLSLAAILGDISICEKIFSGAVQGFGGNPKGRKIHYTRSNCYYQTALKHKNPEFCNHIKSLSTALLDGSKMSPEDCKSSVASGLSASYPSFVDTAFFSQLGYSDADLPQSYKDRAGGSDGLAWEFYIEEKLATTSDFKKRIRSLPTYTQ